MLLVAALAVVPAPWSAGVPSAAADSRSEAREHYQAGVKAYNGGDYKVAIRDLYLSTVGCVHYSGEKIPDHVVYAKGAMGVHFVNLTIKGPPDPMKPNVLIYERLSQ